MKPRRRVVIFAALGLLVAMLGVSIPAHAQTSVFINEIHYDNSGTDTGEAIEIAGPAGTDLTGWSLVLYNGNGGGVYDTNTLSGVIPNQQGGFGTVSVSYPTNGIQNGSPDGLALIDASSTVIQFLSYEGTFVATDGPAFGMTSTDIGVSEGSGTAVGDSLQLTGSGTVYEDFTWAGPSPETFGLVNTGQTFTGAPPAPALVINEIDYDQPSTDTAEFIEIRNNDSASVDLSAFTLELVNGSGGGALIYDTISLPAVSLAPGDYFVVCANAATVANCDLDDGPDTNFIQNGAPDAVALLQGATIVDAVSYEGDTAAPYTEGSGVGLEDDPSIADGSISRCPDGTDTNQNNVDFIFTASTPGATNACAVAVTELVINEIDYDQSGTDTAEFVEIKNTSTAAVSLDGWTLELVNGSGGGAAVYDTIALPAVSLAAGDYFVVCANAATVADCDLDDGPDTNFIQNGAPDAVGLRDPANTLVDAVSYEGDTGAPYTEGSGAGLVDDPSVANGGISRFPDGVDTDMNNVDLSPRCITPGASNTSDSTDCGPPPPGFGTCGDPATLIHDVQGAGLASPLDGTEVVLEGVVVGDFEGSTELRGFFLQEEDGQDDGDPMTSEGIFVFNNGFGPGVNPGDTVRVRGTVDEFFNLTELTSVNALVICPAAGAASPAPWSLPVNSVSDWEWVEGMQITIDQTLYASGNFTQARFGEVDLSVGGPLDNPTNVVDPGAPAIALQDLNDRSRIQMDDGSTIQNPLPLPPYLGAGNTLRTGDTIPDLTGVVSFSFGNYEIHPTVSPVFSRDNPRPDVPDVGGTIQVAAYNVLNYFTTLDNAGPICGPLGDQGCRGADNASEFSRQRDKIIVAIAKLDADVVGLMEIENAPDNAPEFDLVAGLNAATAPGTYDYIAAGPIGPDAIRVALLYQPALVTPLGGFAVLDTDAFLDPASTGEPRNRAALAQTFVENSSGGVFTVVVNHLKSKSGSEIDDPPDGICVDADPDNDIPDCDQGDGQGFFNHTRTLAAAALADWVASDPTGSGDSDFLIIGDLNAYAQEDPIVTLEAAGYADLIEAFVGSGFADGAYSFNFFSQSGYLDHGMSSPTMTPQVTGAAFWHVNADEPSGLDYNDFNQPDLYNPDEFRSSDHDPVVIGLDMGARGAKERVQAELAALLPTGDSQDDFFIQKAIDRIGESLNPDWWQGEALDPKTGNSVFDREHQAVVELQKVATVDVSGAINQILEADEQLALKELIAAINSGGDPDRIAQAQANMADAAANIANGDYAKAVLDYKKAWTNAVKAQ